MTWSFVDAFVATDSYAVEWDQVGTVTPLGSIDRLSGAPTASPIGSSPVQVSFGHRWSIGDQGGHA
jgi:hypothetical protein